MGSSAPSGIALHCNARRVGPPAGGRTLVRHIARRQEEAATTKAWKDSGYLFTSVTGAPLHERNLRESFHALCDTAKVPKIRFHDVRHTAGTLQGADALVIQEVLGHTQLRTTVRYTHIPISVTKQAINRLDALYTAAPENPNPEAAKPAAVPTKNGPQQIQ